jgi:hypothetical protein
MSEREDSRIEELLGEAFGAPDETDERRARSAAVAAFNRIEEERHGLVRRERRQSRLRALVLFGGWIAALALIVRGFVGWPAVAPAVTEVSTSPVVNGAAEALSVAPWHLAAGLALLVVTAILSIRVGIAEG